MSTTFEMTSPSSSIVVVDKSGSVDASNLIQTSTTQHIHQPQQIRAQQVIVNEEYLSGDNIVTAGNVNYLKTNDLLNNAQIIQFVSDEQAALLEQRQPTIVGQNQDEYIKTVLPSTITAGTHPNSKVHVISNVTLVSKADQQQTINFVNSKHVQSASGTGNFVNTYISTKTPSQLQNKMVNIPFKASTITQMERPTHIATAQQQPQQQHIITKHLNSASAIVQKIPIQRNILLSTGRLTQAEVDQQTHPNQFQWRHSDQDALNRTTVTATAQHQTSQLGSVIQIQKPTNKNNQQTIKLVNHAIAGATTVNATLKHGNNTTGIKTIQGIRANEGMASNSTYTAKNLTAIQQKNQTKSSKLIKHNNNNNNNNSLNNNIAPMPSSSFSNNTSSLSASQSKASHKINNNSININDKKMSRNNNNNNIISNNNNTKQLQQRATVQTVNNVCVQPNVIGHTTATKNVAGKYIVQQNQISHVAQPYRTTQTAPYRTIERIQSDRISESVQSDRTTAYRSIQPTPQFRTVSGNNIPKTATSWNASGRTVLAERPDSLQSTPISDTHNQQQTVRTMIHHPLTAAAADQSHQMQSIRVNESGSHSGYHHVYAEIASDTSKTQSTKPSSVDDIIMVNGTHMSEEMSARILQSLSQKSMYNNSNNSSNINNSSGSINSAGTVLHRPVQSKMAQSSIHRATQPASYRSAQSSRSYVDHSNKSGPEYFRVNTSDIQSTTSTFVDNIPLVSARGDDHYNSNANDQDDDIIGEEVRPLPIDSSMDARMRALHTLLQDHTYVQMPKKSPIPALSAISTPPAAISTTTHATQLHSENTASTTNVVSIVPSTVTLSSNSTPTKEKQSTTMQTIDSVVAGAGGNNFSISSRSSVDISPNHGKVVRKNMADGSGSLVNKYQPQPNSANLIPGFPFAYNSAMNKDDDANSLISNGSRNKSDIDLGEETETAPEGEGEDDSVTRCICELTHDDGYMICCDKCSVWQHVDCMGIDRQNIPEEYKCELCQPRTIDHNRARTLQLMKRKEQQNFLLMNSTQSQQQSQQTSAGQDEQSATQNAPNSADRSQLNAFSTIAANKKKGTLNPKNRKADLFGAGSSTSNKRKRSDSTRGSSSKRRETKKALSSKRKSSSANSSNASTPVKPHSANSSSENANDKQAANLRSWIENYETAMTNHYSPELRARLHSITKQSSTQTSAIPMLKNANSLDNKCTTVPHAGAKILISTREISPNNPVIEIRGKYMLSTQYKPHQLTNSQPSGSTRNMSKFNPGPFLFFYRLPNDGPEICVDTRTYGNEGRFVRRSCRPNAEILHTIEKGIPHLYIVSLNTIRASTEITIRHEPHDLESLARNEISAPTSTQCGCGLIKDCIFGTTLNAANAPTTPTTPTSASKKSLKRTNGHIKEKNATLTLSSPPSSSQHRKKNKGSQPSTRNRSTSGSGDSHIGMLSPSSSKSSLNNFQSTDEQTSGGTKANENVLASTNQSVLSAVNSSQDPQQNDLALGSPNSSAIPSPQTTDAKASTRNPSAQTNTQQSTTAGAHSISTKSLPSGMKSPQATNNAESPQKESISVDVEIPPPSPCKSVDDKILKTPPLTPVSGSILKSPSNKSNSHKKSLRKTTYSLSEDSSSIMGDEFTSSSKKDKDAKKTVENKKLTREERKMEAIVRAFEKMEKTEQRKNEQNKHKSTSSAHSSNVTSSSTTSNKRRTSSSHSKDKGDGDKSKKSNLQHGRRKRKRGKSYSQPNHQRRRRNRFDSHNTDDGNTSDESNAPTPMMSPKLQASSSHEPYDRLRNVRTLSESNEKSDNLAAGLLLSLSNYGTPKNSDKNCLSSPDRYSKSTSNTPPFAVSSACLLIEAAVGPLDNDFKLPTKTKTKKTIMNEWLHQSDGTSSYSPHNQDQQQILSPSIEHYSHIDSNSTGNYHDEPQSFSIAAQKIEEFIHMTSSEQQEDDESSKWSGSPICTSSEAMTVPTPLPTPPLQMGSSVKKRWLRQAISEECSDDILASSSTTSSPPNGFMAPLKKRRVARQCSDMNSENLPSPVLPNSYESIEEKHSEHLMYDDKNDDTNEEIGSQDHEIDAYEEEEDTNAAATIKSETEPYGEEVKVNLVGDEVIPISKDKVEIDETDKPVADTCQTGEKVEIKMEVDDIDEEMPFEVKEEPKMVPSTAEDVKPLNTDVEDDVKVQLQVAEISSCEIKKDEELEVKKVDQPITDEQHSHKLENEKLTDEEKDQTVTAPTVLPKEEIEDIQQKLHSFHSENLMILQTRNKKRISRATTPTSFDETSNSASTSSQLKDSFSPSIEQSKKYRKSSNEDREIKREENTSSNNSRSSRLDNEYSGEEKIVPIDQQQAGKDFLRHHHFTAKSQVEEDPAYSPYIQSATAMKPVGYQSVRTPKMSEMPPTAPLYQSTMTPPSFAANVHPQLSANISTSNSLYQYLENPNRSYSLDAMSKSGIQGAGYNTFVPNNATDINQEMLLHSRPPPTTDFLPVNNKANFGCYSGKGSTDLSTAMFAIHQNIPPPTLLNSSNYLTKSYSTLSEPSSTGVTAAPSNATPSCSSNPLNPKVLTRTQSADPRLNPQKDLPPVTPKRKLSINEYRKRKQLGTNNADKPKVEESEKNDTVIDPSKLISTEEKQKNGTDIADTKETVFSPAPTLLELQQESLSIRLKSYKSLHGLTSTAVELASAKESALDNEISTSISEELNASHSLESSRISSSNSENEGDRTPTFNEHTDQDACDFDPDVDDFLAPNLDRPKSNSSLNLDPISPESPLSTISNEASEQNKSLDEGETSVTDETADANVEQETKTEPINETTATTSSGSISPNESTSR